MFLNSEKEILLNQNFLKLAVFAEYMIFFSWKKNIQGGKHKAGREAALFLNSSHYFFRRWMGVNAFEGAVWKSE